jgi:hypothetical protein
MAGSAVRYFVSKLVREPGIMLRLRRSALQKFLPHISAKESHYLPQKATLFETVPPNPAEVFQSAGSGIRISIFG